MVHFPRFGRPRGALLVAFFAASLAFPLGVLASHQFSDVPTDYAFHQDIDAIADAGVTTGCGGGKYCPTQNVTRGEMAAFMNRLGALGAGKTPVVNANTARSTDGWSIGCPSATRWSGGVCIETTGRTASTYFDAADACAGISGILGSGWRYRLPSTAELMGARGVTGIALDAGGEWSDAIHGESGGYFSITVTDAGVINQETTITNNAYRCVTPPLSVDFNLIIISEQDRYPAPAVYDDLGAVTDAGSLPE